MVAALVVAWVPTVYDVAASAYVDLAIAAYTAMAVHAFVDGGRTLDSRHLAWVTVGIGGALAIKLSAAFLILPLALLALLRSLTPASGRSSPSRGTAVIAGSAIGALSAGVALAAPWYIRTGSAPAVRSSPSTWGSGPPRHRAGTSSAPSSTRRGSRSTGMPTPGSTTC